MRAMDSVLKKTGYFKSFDGADIYFESRGQGRPVIFCYGIGCLFNHWSPQIRHFSKFSETLMFDYRGHQKTPIPENKESLTIDALSKDLIEFCKQNNVESADFVGHSFGCQVLLQAYRSHPDLFRSLTFVNGLYRNPFEHIMEADDLVERLVDGGVDVDRSAGARPVLAWSWFPPRALDPRRARQSSSVQR